MDERRNGTPPIPDNIGSWLNDIQMRELHALEGFGWELVFIRRPLFQDPIIVMAGPNDGQYGVLELDGSFIQHPAWLTIR